MDKEGINVTFNKQFFYEFIIRQNQNNRYFYFIDYEESIFFLADTYDQILNNEVIGNLLSALKLWDIYCYHHVLDVYILGSKWLYEMDIQVTEEDMIGFLLHDIGKIKIPREILLKESKLTSEEIKQMELHTIYGEQILAKLGFSETICQMAKYHHIRFDQSGYPTPVPPKVPFIVRALMIIDVFSALTLDRPYRTACTFEEALDVLVQEREKFDVKLVDEFVRFIRKKLQKTIPVFP